MPAGKGEMSNDQSHSLEEKTEREGQSCRGDLGKGLIDKTTPTSIPNVGIRRGRFYSYWVGGGRAKKCQRGTSSKGAADDVWPKGGRKHWQIIEGGGRSHGIQEGDIRERESAVLPSKDGQVRYRRRGGLLSRKRGE